MAFKRPSAEQEIKDREFLIKGGRFLKYGRQGDPHVRHVCLTRAGLLCWSEHPIDPADYKHNEKHMDVKDIVSVTGGTGSKVFQRDVAQSANPDLCFTVAARDRTLDLQATSQAERIQWVQAISSVMDQRARGVLDFFKGTRYEPLRVAEKRDLKKEAHFREILLKGHKFMKYGRQGDPHVQHVALTKNGLLCWSTDPIDPGALEHKEHHIDTIDVVSVAGGANSEVFKRDDAATARQVPERCFTVATKTRSLDLQADNVETRNLWIQALSSVVDQRQAGVTDFFKGTSFESSEKRHTTDEDDMKYRRLLVKGGKFLKFGRYGTPHDKVVFLSASGRLHWSTISMDGKLADEINQTFIDLKDVVSVASGNNSAVFQRDVAKAAVPERCLTVSTKERTLDLQAASTEERNLWIQAISNCVEQRQRGIIDFSLPKP